MAGSKAVAGIKSVSLDTLLPMWKKLPINIGIIMTGRFKLNLTL